MAIKKRTEPPVDVFVQPNKTIFLTVDIGNGQIGGSILKFKDMSDVLAKGKIKDIELSKAEQLIGKTLKITTNVLDSNASTNKIAITHNFKNCNPDSFSYSDEVDNNGDILSLIREYNFKQ